MSSWNGPMTFQLETCFMWVYVHVNVLWRLTPFFRHSNTSIGENICMAKLYDDYCHLSELRVITSSLCEWHTQTHTHTHTINHKTSSVFILVCVCVYIYICVCVCVCACASVWRFFSLVLCLQLRHWTTGHCQWHRRFLIIVTGTHHYITVSSLFSPFIKQSWQHSPCL